MQRVAISRAPLRVHPDTWPEAAGSPVAGNTVRNLICAALVALPMPLSTAGAAELPPVTLAWNRNPESNVSYYELRYGMTSGDYSNKVYTGAEPTAVVSGLQDNTTYYFVVVARNRAGQASPNSKELSYRVNGPVAQPPNGKIVSPAEDLTIAVGDTVDFTGNAKDPTGSKALTYRWNFGSGSGISASDEKSPGLRRFNIPGTYTITFDVINKLGKEDPTPSTRVIKVKAPAYKVLARKGWKLKYVNSQDAVNYPARYAFDDDPNTFWHTEWGKPGLPPPPHEIQIDLGKAYTLNGFQYLPRQDGFVVGNIGNYRFYVSSD
ncbi:MAG: PKD domain-containing protein, partial [Verrucomicrobiaceae bacterium]